MELFQFQSVSSCSFPQICECKLVRSNLAVRFGRQQSRPNFPVNPRPLSLPPLLSISMPHLELSVHRRRRRCPTLAPAQQPVDYFYID